MTAADPTTSHHPLTAEARAQLARLRADLASPFPPRHDLARLPAPARWAPGVAPGSLADLLSDGPLQHVPDPLLRRDLIAQGLAVPFLAEVVRSPVLPARAPARGAAAALQLGPRSDWAVVAGPTAWWVHTGTGDPATVHVHAETRHRGPDWLAVSQCGWCTAAIPLADQVERIGGARVTSPALTAADLLRTEEPEDSVPAVSVLLRNGLTSRTEVASVLDRLSGALRVRRARQLLATASRAPAAPAAQATVPWTGLPSAVTR